MAAAAPSPATAAWGTVLAQPAWQAVDCVSDLHLHPDDPATCRLFLHWLQHCDANAVCILGDLFEAWVGDDVLDSSDTVHALPQAVCQALRAASQKRPVYLLHGNRDFLIGPRFCAATGVQALPDPTLLRWGDSSWLLSHGDAWCLDDTDYLRFRDRVRSAAWQADFLRRPLAEREALAREMRRQSQAHQQRQQASGQPWADVDSATSLQWLQASGAAALVHGHTHHPADHDLPGQRHRLVLSDWDAQARPARAEVLRLLPDGRWERRSVTPCP